MFIGFIIWIVGWSMYHGVVTCFSAGLIGIWKILKWAKQEESRPEAAYSEDYLRYRGRMWFWWADGYARSRVCLWRGKVDGNAHDE